MSPPLRPLSFLAIGAIILMAAALAADVAVNSTNISLSGYADFIGPPPAANDSVLDVTMTGSWASAHAGGFYAPTTGTAVFADAGGGAGVIGDSDGSYGVWGASGTSWGGYFTSSGGYGIRVATTGTAHYDHGAYVTATSGFAVYGQSTQNMAVRGEAGDVTGLWQPVGSVGAVGIGQSRGMYASGGSSYGIYGTSLDWYGIYGRTSRSDNNYGLYTPDNLYAANATLLGATTQVVHNGGDEPLEVGDVVVYSGILKAEARGLKSNGEPAAFHDQPVVQVAKASSDAAGLLAGVVLSRFDLEAVEASQLVADDIKGDDLPARGRRTREADPPGQERVITPPGAVAPGEYLLVVVQGPARVRVDAVEHSVEMGDVLALGSERGWAVHEATAPRRDGAESGPRPRLVGAALEPLNSDRGMIYTYVSTR